MDKMPIRMSYLIKMYNAKKWDQNRAIFRSFSGKAYDHRLSCGFMNKSGVSIDINDEQYDRLAMVYLLRGRGEYSDSTGIQYSLKPGDLFFRCPDRRHTHRIDPDSQWLECFLSVRAEWYDLLLSIDLMDPNQPCMHIGEHPEIPEKVDRLLKQLAASDTPLSNSDHEFEILTLMRQILRQNLEPKSTSSRQREQLDMARERIRQQATASVSLESILSDIGLSYSRLRSLFQNAYRISPGDYRIQVRIEQACALLETSDLSVQAVADQLGYADAFTFSKQFKKRTGLSPKHFRRHS